MKPAPPVTSARIVGSMAGSSAGRRQSAQEVEYGVADREMPDLDKTVAVGRDVEVPSALAAQRVFGREAAQRRDRAAGRGRGVDGIEDVGGAAGARNRDHEVAGAGMQLDLLGEHAVIAEVVAEAGEHARVVERE